MSGYLPDVTCRRLSTSSMTEKQPHLLTSGLNWAVWIAFNSIFKLIFTRNADKMSLFVDEDTVEDKAACFKDVLVFSR